MADSGAIHNSYWRSGQPLEATFPKLAGEHDTDVLVIGAGITGLSAGLELIERGYRVCICDASVIGAGTTGGSSGHLDFHPEMGPRQLRSQLGDELAAEYVRFRKRAIATIQSRADEATDFSHVPAWYFSEQSSSRESLQKELKAATAIGIESQWHDAVPLSFASCGYRLEGCARIDCLAYLRRLARVFTEAGGTIFERTLVKSPGGKAPKSVEAGDGQVTFNHVVCAVHGNNTEAMRIHSQIPPMQSYVLAARVADPPPDALFWDDENPYHYIRWARSSEPRLILVGGYDHRTGAGDSAQAVALLEAYTSSRFRVEEIVSVWSAELFEPADGLPIIGLVPGTENVWIATGLSGVGLTQGTGAAAMLAALINGRSMPLEKPFSPSRFGLKGAADLVGAQLKSAANLAERVLPATSIDPETLLPGEGAVGKVDGKFTAVCRTHDGREHRCRPVCTHMGGVPHWNDLEQTWDCPVHGGRFNADGARLYGPPEKPLGPPTE